MTFCLHMNTIFCCCNEMEGKNKIKLIGSKDKKRKTVF